VVKNKVNLDFKKRKKVIKMTREKVARSTNPDLLFEDTLKERVDKISDYWEWREGSLDEVDRVTVFATHRCNFKCAYCNGPHMNLRTKECVRERKMLKSDLKLSQFVELLDSLKDKRFKHIHFTGGEATLNSDLLAMVVEARKYGAMVSITTNGTAPSDLYKKLIEAGLSEIRISFDTNEPTQFDKIVGSRGAFAKVLKNIKEIVRLRDEENKDVFLVLNVCVGAMNLLDLEEILRFLIALDPNDIKLLVIAQDKESVCGKQGKEIKEKLQSLLASFPPTKFLLLRKKIDRLSDGSACGLKDPESQNLRHCFIPMTERTIDGSHYFPCSIYLRYYGNPIGDLTDSVETQQERIMDFVRNHDCRLDPICREHCINCCKTFNLRTAEILAANDKKIIVIKEKATRREIDGLLAEVSHRLESGIPSERPFLIIKPHGMQWYEEILKFIVESGNEIESIIEIPEWDAVAKLIYVWPLSRETAKDKIERSRAFRGLESGRSLLIRFKRDPDPVVLLNLKNEIRKHFPTERYLTRFGYIKTKQRRRRMRLTAVHTPDAKDIVRENTILSSLLNNG